MKRKQHTEDSSSLAARERAQYYKELDRIEGLEVESETEEALESIPDSTQRLLLKNYYSFMREADGYDPFRNLLDEDSDPYQGSMTESLLDAYKW